MRMVGKSPKFKLIFFRKIIYGIIIISLFGCSKPPNIIIILADDAGYADFGFTGSKEIKTPNIDNLAYDGVVFKNAYVSASVCSPSRAGLLTGMYQQRFGHECNLDSDVNNSFDPNQITIAEALKTKGYKTGIIGKWHLGDKPQNHPLENGFDYFWGFLSGARNYFYNPEEKKRNSIRNVIENYSQTSFEGYLTDVLGKKAADFAQESYKSNTPFFLFLSFNAPHTPLQAKKEVLDQFKKNPRKVYASMMWSMDEAVGILIDKLKKNKQYENTIIYFLSDNGAAMSNGASSYPHKGWKGNQFEGGIKTPMIMTWKKKIKEKKQYYGFVSALDIFTTSSFVAGVDKLIIENSDGKNILTKLSMDRFENEDLFWRKDKMATVRSGKYKLIRLNDSITVLYDLNSSEVENKNLKNELLSVHDSLFRKLKNWEKKLISPNWVENGNWNNVTEMIYQDLMTNDIIRAYSPRDLN